MIIAKVVGNVVATKKNEGLVGEKLLIVNPIKRKDKNGWSLIEEENLIVAVDSVGAGIGETVLLVTGSTASKIIEHKNAPVDAAIIGIIDEIEMH
ncbi:EutN/CcmL family microcompartment protein [Thermosediminibacter oceani]|uniref:Ethanolamine utilization protein EutN/carboxysome structural protein Ccml n=1 Tax=Thermosediminibacter oceani (strain ATCC BAA-1034 / DSM 16646 / JW/IW-1228P) TaxID=555079 RepID=D9S1Q4_THEOJ|nr:EutN/CcmL family microcompartment protein [Thermosediminibacter oceani]ADL07331.1 Ethanolamine utilization protein EutN/carboxysome structural protein Ccml [Thermosediminibacter oceani DSM 16646]